MFLENVAAGDVGREEIRRELDAAELEREEPRQRFHQLGLAESGQAFEQHGAREQRRDDFVDRLFPPRITVRSASTSFAIDA